MKIRILLFGFLLSATAVPLLTACCDDDEDECVPCYCSEKGIVLGEDPRDCVCCGGWFIEIGGDTLRAMTLPQEFIQNNLPGEYPIPVYLEWTPDETPCLGDEIEVECIRLRE